jgi:hypothetical protein
MGRYARRCAARRRDRRQERDRRLNGEDRHHRRRRHRLVDRPSFGDGGACGDVVVVEPNPTYEFAASPRATGGIRQLFTVTENIRMARYGHEIEGQFETLMAVDGDPAPIDFHRMGYLRLGSGQEDVDLLMANWRVQIAHNARVELL